MKRSFKLGFTAPKQVGGTAPTVVTVQAPVTPDAKRSKVDSIDTVTKSGLEMTGALTSRQVPSSGTQTATQVTPVPVKKTFTLPQRKLPLPTPTPVAAPTNAGQTPSVESAGPKYYSILYTKFSTKKHKVYDDGVLTLNGTHAIIQNMEGKQVTKASTKFKELPLNGTLGVGGFDLEAQSEIPPAEYTSGRVFIGAATPTTTTTTFGGKKGGKKGGKGNCEENDDVNSGGGGNNVYASAIATTLLPAKKFKPVMESAPGTGGQKLTPRHSPDAPDALILQTPASGQVGVPVVVDPFVSSKLRPHQKDAVRFMWECVNGLKSPQYSGCILADEMGLGKTLSTITLIWTMCRQSVTGNPAASKVIVVTPSGLVGNWRAEFKKWLTNQRVTPLVVNVTGKEAQQVVDDFVVSSSAVSPVLIISYEMYRKYSDRLHAGKIGLLVCDEGHRLKNSDGNKTIAALAACPAKKRVLLSGTPVQNDLTEFYAMVNFVNPGVLGDLPTFRRVFQLPIEKGRDKSAPLSDQLIGQARSEELARLTSTFILRRTSSILQGYLPPKSEIEVFVHMSDLQRQLYERLLSSTMARSVVSGRATGSESALLLIGWLKRLCCHPDFLYNKVGGGGDDEDGFTNTDATEMRKIEKEIAGFHSIFPSDYPFAALAKYMPTTTTTTTTVTPAITDMSAANHDVMLAMQHAPKFALLDALLRESKAVGDRVVVVSNSTAVLDMIQCMCTARGHKYMRLDGKTDSDKRQPMVDKFNDPASDVFVFLLSSKAGGVGLNLIGANRLVLFDPDWNPAVDRQAMARVWRDGQRKRVYIYRLLSAGSIEEKMFQRQILKEEVSKAVVDTAGGGDGGNRNFTRQDIKELFVLGRHDEEQSCETYRLLIKKASEGKPKPTTAVIQPKKAVKKLDIIKSNPKKKKGTVIDDDEEDEADVLDLDFNPATSFDIADAFDKEGDDDDVPVNGGCGGEAAFDDSDGEQVAAGDEDGSVPLWQPYESPKQLLDSVLACAVESLPAQYRVPFVHEGLC